MAAMSTRHDRLNDLDKKAMKVMSKLDVPRKLFIFGWCVFHNLLPTRFNLLTRGITHDAMCKLCGQEVEDDTHIFWRCSCVTSVFAKSSFNFLRQQHYNSCKRIIRNLISNGNVDMLQEYLVMCWRVWDIRNSFYQTGTAPDFTTVPHWCTEYIDQLKAANHLQYTGFGKCLPVATWKKPLHGFCKLNVDAGRGSCGDTMGFGAVLRDANGFFIAARSWKQAGHANTVLMKAKAVLLGIEWLLELQVRHVEIKSDSVVVIKYLTGKDHRLVSSLGHLIDDIKSLSVNFRVILHKHVLRTANQPAHHLAKLATLGGSCSTWWQHPPPSIGHWLCVDNID